MKHLILAIAGLSLAPPHAAAAPAAAEAGAEVQAEAIALARVLNSEAIIIGDADSDSKVVALMDQLADGSTELSELEASYPGVLRELAVAMLPIINRSLRERLPELHRRQAALYRKSFTAAELRTLTAFYSSPTGQKLIRNTFAALEPQAVIEDMKQSPDFEFSTEAVLKDMRAAAAKAAETLDSSDHTVLAVLAGTGLLPRMRAVAPQTQAVAIQWMNEEASWEAAETDRVLEMVIGRRMESEE